jgi:uncharacterized protein (TIGR02217 family)
MTFRNIRFPTGIKYGAVSGPRFSTRRGRVRSGRTQRNAEWEFPLRKFAVERALRTAALRDALWDFFYVVNGDLDTFRIKDHGDYQVSASQGVFYALGSSRFQMAKRYSLRSVAESSPNALYTKDVYILLPVEDTIVIPGLTEATHWTLESTVPGGIITTIGSPTPTPSSWSGEYDVLARFDQDELMLEAVDKLEGDDLFMTSQQITIMEERL